ncbi:GAF and ANTAR domain-containing protein [Mycobacterium sp. 1423905.2]|uniref:GAF and ANTAR domain-containing protein n=1 Tax=Mycobacterium sp. 1423905.2 TaxID=1856859 RepID=UPI0007FF27FA|nr:GAF and ANTAR domain-containing protein [Mycobacterium sp. 1423905.2]OBJ53158.1 response regulator receiver protein [Mycobacterium sp. 1423905.2]
MPQQGPVDARATLDEITETAVKSVPGALHAGVTLTQRRRVLETPSATDDFAVLIDQIQGHLGEGPCLSAAWQHHTIHIDDLGAEQRWPRYREEALRQTPIRSILSFLLFNDRQSAGAFNLYADDAHAFDDEAIEVGLAFATHTALAWNILRRDQQFHSALASRDTIGQAKGMLMERFSIDALAAFDLLKRLSQESNDPVAEIAHRLVNTPPAIRRPN